MTPTSARAVTAPTGTLAGPRPRGREFEKKVKAAAVKPKSSINMLPAGRIPPYGNGAIAAKMSKRMKAVEFSRLWRASDAKASPASSRS